MDLTLKDRLILSNQFRILQVLDPANKEVYEEHMTIVDKGFKHDYDALVEYMSDELSEEISKEVYAILQLYRFLNISYQELDPTDKKQIKKEKLQFEGFDGNNESLHRSYCHFLLQDRGLYEELQHETDYNTHHPFLEKYRRMLGELELMTDKMNLSVAEIQQVINA